MKRFLLLFGFLILLGMPVLPRISLGSYQTPTSGVALAAESGSVREETLSPTVQRLISSWPWYLTRAAGLLAAVLLFLLTLSGIGLVTGYTYRLLEPIAAWNFHRSLGIALIYSVLVHILSLLFDRFRPFSLASVLIPFQSDFHPIPIFGVAMGSLLLTLGILSFYLLIPIIWTSLRSMESKKAQWKFIHYFSYLVAVFVFFHSLYLGTDMTNPFVHYSFLIVGILMLVGGGVRLTRVGSLNHEE